MESLSWVSQIEIVLAFLVVALVFAIGALTPIAVGWAARKMGFRQMKSHSNIGVGLRLLMKYFLHTIVVVIIILTIVEIIIKL